MKRTRELTAIHYRRSIRTSASSNVQNLELQGDCPVCGTRLAVSLGKDSADRAGVNAAQKATFRVVQKRHDQN